MPLVRLDELMVKKGLVDSRSLAQSLIKRGEVKSIDGTTLLKPGKKIDASMELLPLTLPPYVSRAGEKLAAFLKQFALNPENQHILDVGASTGGFTDCLLQHGACSATCIDVGHSQLHKKLLHDERVSNFEGINARHLTADMLPFQSYPLIVMDLSFISIRLVLPQIWPLLAAHGTLVALIKPQFEATQEECNKTKGIIKDPKIHNRILKSMKQFIQSTFSPSKIIGLIESPIQGGDGNKEFLIGVHKG